MTHKQKRNRLPNFTPAEESFLLSLAHKHVDVIESRLTDGQIWEEKRKVWENINIEFGKKFGFRRGWKNLREKYDNLKRKLRRLESIEINDGQTQKIMVNENIEKLAVIVGLSADCSSNDVENDDTFETDPEMNNDFDETVHSCSFGDPIQDSEPVEKEGENKWFSSNSNHSAQNGKIKSLFRRPNRKERFSVKEELRSAEKHRWDSKRNKREAEKHRWEFEKHKLVIEKQKWELKETRLKAKLLQMKLKSFVTRDGSKSPISAINTQNVDEAQNLINIDALSTKIKVEPTLDITDIGNGYATNSSDDCASMNRLEKRKTTDVNGEVLGDMRKKLKTIQPVSSDEQQQWERSLKNDMLDTSIGADSSFLDPMQSVNANISSYICDDDNDVACNVPGDEYIPLEATTDDQMKVSTDEHDFLKLLNKHKLQHYLAKLKEINIGLDYLQYIEEEDVRDLCSRDIGARIRFRGLLEDWRTSHRLSETVFNPLTKFDEAKRDIIELKAIIKDAQNTFLKDQNNTGTPKECQCSQNSNYKNVIPETPFRSVLDFEVFEKLIKSSEEAYRNLVAELTAQHISNSVSFLKISWRRMMSDQVAQHFCWTGTIEKPAIRALNVTKALREAYQRKFHFSTNGDFQHTVQSFFQHAKTRLQKKQNYEKLKATNITS